MPSTSVIGRKIVEVVKPGMKRKDLIVAVRERWPNVSRKKILRSTFEALTRGDGEKPRKTGRGHGASAQPAPTYA